MKGFLKDVLEGKVREVRKWIEKGENVSQFDDYGNTALHLAAEKGLRGVCKVLLDAGADINQRNSSVGWAAVHYAAYEGHADVLRMLIAHGAIPDLQDKSGDTPETFATEWQNAECVAILREATAARRDRDMSEMMDSDENRSDDSDDEDDEDESSMMNWIMPPPSVPKQPNVSVTLPAANVSLQAPVNTPATDTELSFHLQPPPPPRVQPVVNTASDVCNNSVPDLSDTSIVSRTLREDEYSGDESDDTLKLMLETRRAKNRERDNSARSNTSGMSIVDKIKNNLQIQKNEQAKECVSPSQGIEDRRLGGRPDLDSFSLSSATIPDDMSMTMSSASVYDKMATTSSGSGSDGEKEQLLKRLKELMMTEESEMDRNLREKKTKLTRMESEYTSSVNELKKELKIEEESLLSRQVAELNSLKELQSAEEERIQVEIRKLESNLESILAPSKMISTLVELLL